MSEVHGMSVAMPAQNRSRLRVNFSSGEWAAAAANVPGKRWLKAAMSAPGGLVGRRPRSAA
ncbi:hypothetical protein OG512_05915 [Streptomyces sp. NBC_01378]|uniref:hypothetical protein n=1 Tax=Streptomyces sp. NBC_01378 TaxID=2903844 RepID=UPI0032509067